MKKIFSIMLMSAAATSALLTSCLDLDSDKYFDDRSTLESVFSSKTQSDEWLAYAYTFLTGVNTEIGSKGDTSGSGGSWNPFCFADDMYYGDRDNTVGGGDMKDADWANYQAFRQGLYNEDNGRDAWTQCYRGIYQASIFIHNIYRNTELNEKEIEDYRGQARFVRAYYYWLLLRKYGPVPIMPDEGADYDKSYDELSVPRSSYEEVAEYISSEMIKAANEIKANVPAETAHRGDANICRPTVGACLATRALAYIYAASPLANGQLKNGTNHKSWNLPGFEGLVTDNAAHSLINKDGKKLVSWEYDEAKWARAAAACKDVMNLKAYQLYVNTTIEDGSGLLHPTVPGYKDGDFSTRPWNATYDYDNAAADSWGYSNIDPMRSYADIFNGASMPNENEEVIFTRGKNGGTNNHTFGIGSLVLHSMPTTLGGWNTHGMTQKMCDAYYMKDGSDCPGKDAEMVAKETGAEPAPRAKGWLVGRKGVDDPKTGLYYAGLREDPNDPESDLRFPEAFNDKTNKITLQYVSMQYINREPRFYASVAFSGCVWEQLGRSDENLKNQQIFYYRGDGNGYLNAFTYLRTGIGVKKFYHPNDYAENQGYGGIADKKCETTIRFADILLMYAEAINELTTTHTVASWDGSTTYTLSRSVDEIKKGIRPVRARAGVPDLKDEIYADQSEMRESIKRERMIELFAEGKRYFDLRRWMDAPVEESRLIYGLNVFNGNDYPKNSTTPSATDFTNRNEFMKVIPCYNLQTSFGDKQYFWPICFSELKRNKNLIQNPGWNYND